LKFADHPVQLVDLRLNLLLLRIGRPVRWRCRVKAGPRQVQLARDAQARIQAIEARVDQLLDEVPRCENLIARLDYLDYIAQFGFDASGANFAREDERQEARETRRLRLVQAVRVLFDGLAKEHWSVLAPDADTFIQGLPKIADHVLTRCGRKTEVVQETEKRILEWRRQTYQTLADRETEAATRPVGSRSGRGPAYQKLTQFKSKHRITDDGLAEKMGIERSVYYELKKGKTVSEMTYHKAASVLECDPSELKPKK
jgi:DNA-binding Xre family transcriptional regulator